MCCLFGVVDHALSLTRRQRQRLVSSLSIAAQARGTDATGLGLSIARSFTEACGGTLAVETVADLFTVQVSFPLTPGP